MTFILKADSFCFLLWERNDDTKGHFLLLPQSQLTQASQQQQQDKLQENDECDSFLETFLTCVFFQCCCYYCCWLVLLLVSRESENFIFLEFFSPDFDYKIVNFFHFVYDYLFIYINFVIFLLRNSMEQSGLTGFFTV